MHRYVSYIIKIQRNNIHVISYGHIFKKKIERKNLYLYILSNIKTKILRIWNSLLYK